MVVKKVEDVQLSTEEKRCCIEKAHPPLSIKKQCELIGLNRSSYYYHPKKPLQNKDLKLMHLIDDLYTKHPFYGSRQIRGVNRRHPSNEDKNLRSRAFCLYAEKSMGQNQLKYYLTPSISAISFFNKPLTISPSPMP